MPGLGDSTCPAGGSFLGRDGSQYGQPMSTGDVYTIAGSSAGTPGRSGNGGPATLAYLRAPGGVTTDASGNIYIADTSNQQVRKLTSTSPYNINTIAGNGLSLATAGNGGPAATAALNNPAGEAFDSHGDVYIADFTNNRVQEIAAYDHTQWNVSMRAGTYTPSPGRPTAILGAGATQEARSRPP